jgi:hypothetical protein
MQFTVHVHVHVAWQPCGMVVEQLALTSGGVLETDNSAAQRSGQRFDQRLWAMSWLANDG